jgi:hypothetical protein
VPGLDDAWLTGARHWLACLGEPVSDLEVLAGDVSPRRYFRLRRADGSMAILAGYPEESREPCGAWLRSDTLLRRAGVRTPQVLAADCDAGWMLLEDLGPMTLYEWTRGRSWVEIAPRLAAAAAAAHRIRGLDREAVAALHPALDAAALGRELAQTWDLVLEPRGLVGPAPLRRRLRRALDGLAAELGRGPLGPCHRDLMARNLVPLPSGEVAVLDHQDLRLGPDLYDLASLLNDTLYPPPELEEEILAPYVGGPGARLRYRRAAAQRGLKIAGTFEAFRRRGHDRHAALIEPSLAGALRHLAALPETAELASDLEPLWRARLGAEAGRGAGLR